MVTSWADWCRRVDIHCGFLVHDSATFVTPTSSFFLLVLWRLTRRVIPSSRAFEASKPTDIAYSGDDGRCYVPLEQIRTSLHKAWCEALRSGVGIDRALDSPAYDRMGLLEKVE